MFKDIKAFLLSILQKIKSKKIMKRYPWLLLVCLLTILIPAIIALSYSSIIHNAERENMPKVTVSLYDAKGNSLASGEIDKDIIAGSVLVKTFYDLAQTKVRAEKPIGFNRTQTLVFVLSEGEENALYKCYFNENYEDSYIEDANGQFYAPNSVAYSNFMNSKYSEKVYSQSSPPSLITSNERTIVPSSVDWSYYLINENSIKSSNYETTESILTYRITGALDFKFSKQPDSCLFKVKNSKHETIFTGSAEELYSLTATEGDELSVEVDAKWENKNDGGAYGTQRYEFKIICSEPSEFSISSTTVSGGKFIVISVSDVDRADSIIYNVIKPTEEEEPQSPTDAPAIEEEEPNALGSSDSSSSDDLTNNKSDSSVGNAPTPDVSTNPNVSPAPDVNDNTESGSTTEPTPDSESNADTDGKEETEENEKEKEEAEEAKKKEAQKKALDKLYSFSPTFVKHGNNAYAFLIIPTDIGNTSFTFSLSCGISKAEFTINISEAKSNNQTLDFEEDASTLLIDEEAKRLFLTSLAQISELSGKNASSVFFRNEFLSPAEYGFSSLYDFNTKIDASGNEFILMANVYSAQTDTDTGVCSANVGAVIATGKDLLLGNYVVIDHGMGLCTWYCGLSDVNVARGDILKKGELLGKSGSSLLCENGVSVFCSVGGELINPNAILGASVIA